MVLPSSKRDQRLTADEEKFLRVLIAEQAREAGANGLTFRAWYTVLEKMALSHTSRLAWWPPTNEMRAIIETACRNARLKKEVRARKAEIAVRA